MSTPITHVTGGVAGVAATYAAVRALADRFDAVGDDLRRRAADDARALADPDLVQSAPLSPVTFAEAEARLIDATTGLHGVVEASVAYEADAMLVRATVAAFSECDRLVAEAFSALDYAVGRSIGSALAAAAPEALVMAAVAVPAVRTVWPRLPARMRRRLDGEADQAADGVQEWMADHPEAVQHAVDGGGGLLDGLLSGYPAVPALIGLAAFHPTLGDAAGDLAALYPAEGPPHVRRRRDLSVPLGSTPPDDMAGLLRHLQQTNDLSPAGHPDDQGTIEVQTLHDPDGGVRHIVYLPGTDDMATLPWRQDGDVRDLAADLHLVAGDDTTYAAGIERAMCEAGIGSRDPVLLVGHSLGGMEAASLLAHGSGFHVTHVVTAGSPIAGVHDYPAGSHVLSLENRGDLVPLLDGRDNADSAAQVTVQFDDHETSVAGNHDLRHYVRGAAAADASTDPSVREQLASLRSSGFIGSSATATSQVLQITR